MNKLILASILSITTLSSFAQVKGDEDKEMFNNAKDRDQKAIKDAQNGWWKKSMVTHDQRIAWWRDAKFGMFVHWGIYSLPGGEWKGKKVSGYAEHLMRKEKISRAEYLELAHQFNPVNFNADEWIRTAKNAGMRYFIITAKHHDGFAMYDSKVSDFNIVQQTPFHRDPMKELAAACKKYGIKFGFYYSHAFDWEHPDAPGNDWEYKNPGGDQNLYGGTTWYDQHPELLTKAKKYVDEKAIPQIKELLTQYHPDILWFDTPHKLPLSENIRILEAIRATDPNVVVNGRLVRSGSTGNMGDYANTADRPAEFYPVNGDWEAIPTTNESYGYSKFDDSHKPASFFIQLIAKAAARGGNLLMNIGPKGDGTMDKRDLKILDSIGQWMNVNNEAVYQTHSSVLPFQSWGVTTQKDNKIYLHVFQWPKDGKLYVGGITFDKIAKASLLADKKQLLSIIGAGQNDCIINVSGKVHNNINTVIVLETKGTIKADSVMYIAPNTATTRLLTFDAQQQGKGFSFADGKANHYYVEGWKSLVQSLSWDFRTSAKATYRIIVKYVADNKTSGTFVVAADELKKEEKVEATKGKPDVITKELGNITLAPGVHRIALQAKEITNEELVKPLEIVLEKISE
ncbi:MAG: alpha-L-fucosidase [Filimonas sp.]|nr:alpha-L-fucosidase [Filimonas sp.]